MKAIIIYAGKYGATEQYARWLAESLQFPLRKAGETTAAMLASYDLVILGSSVYVGQLVIRKWLRQHQSALTNKRLLLFVVCGSADKDVAEQQKILTNNLAPQLRERIQAFFLPGRCNIPDLSLKDRLLLRFGTMMAKDPVQRVNMRSGFDRMDRKALDKLISAASATASPNDLTGV